MKYDTHESEWSIGAGYQVKLGDAFSNVLDKRRG